MKDKRITVEIDLGLYASARAVMAPEGDTNQTIIQAFYFLLAIGEITPKEVWDRVLKNLTCVPKDFLDEHADS